MRSRLGLKALGLCALMVGVMAISAGAAQANEASKWMNKGVDVTGATAALQGSLEGSEGKLLTKINGLGIEVICTSGTFNEVKLVPKGTTTEGMVTFTGCIVKKTTPTLGALGTCTVHTEGQPNGTILSLTGVGLLELGAGEKPVTLVIPNLNAKGERLFAHLLFEEGGGPCGVLPEEVPIGGKLAVEDCEGKAKTEQKVHLIVEEKTLSELWAVSNTVEHKVILDGSGLVELADGSNWSGLPN